MFFTTQHKDRVLQLGKYIQKQRQSKQKNEVQTKLYMYTKIINQSVIQWRE